MLRAIDVANLRKGYNIHEYYGIISTGVAWLFIKMNATEDGYRVYQSSEYYWQGISEGKVSEQILSYVNGILTGCSQLTVNQVCVTLQFNSN
jgi:hypothetical protein